MAVLCSVDSGLLPTFKVHKALPARVDVESSTATPQKQLLLCVLFQSAFQTRDKCPACVPALHHMYGFLLVGNNRQLRQGLIQVVTLQNQVTLKRKSKC